MDIRRAFPDASPMRLGLGGAEVMLKLSDMAARPDTQLASLRISPSRRILSGPAGQASLEPRIMQVLLLLLDGQGAVVTRTQLFDECWGGAMVGDDSINRAIGRLRRVIADVAPGALEIETIPRTGYRLVTSDQAATSPEVSVEHVLSPTDGPRRRISRRWFAGGALAAAVGGAWWWSRGRSESDPSAPLIEESRIALRSGTADGDRQAMTLLERAVALSPENAEAWGLLALARALVDEHSSERLVSSLAAVQMAVERALRIDEDNADAQAALTIALPYFGDWLAAERRFDAVLARHPGHLFAQDSRSFFLGAVGRLQESAHARLAFATSAPPDPDLEHRHVYALWFLGRITDANRVASRGLEIWPRHPGLWFARLWLLTGTGGLERALAHVADGSIRPPLPPPMIATLRGSVAAAISRRPDEIEAAVKLVMAGVSHSVAGVVNAMMLLNVMGATDQAFQLAEAYYLERGPVITAMSWRPGQPMVPDQRRRKTNMLFTPTAAAMQRDPRFLPLMEEIGLADYWGQRRVVPDFLARRGA
jgi:DNA-binding winged helix-turn-helix (wHTH) protein/tetratricopeptide (TPR) repeat protein